MLFRSELMPFAIQIFKPGGQDRGVYQLDPRTSVIDKGLGMFRDFSRPVTPLGYKFILDDVSSGAKPRYIPALLVPRLAGPETVVNVSVTVIFFRVAAATALRP